jgi:hypothetical protein
MPILDGIEVPGELAAQEQLAIDVQAWQDAVAGARNPFEQVFVNIPPLIPELLKDVQFQGLELRVPAWAEFIAQSSAGTIEAFEREPRNYGGFFGSVGGRRKVIVRPEPYPVVMEHI